MAVDWQNGAGLVLAGMFGTGMRVSGTVADPNWADVLTLMHFYGVNNGTAFYDLKGVIWTSYGNAKISTTQSKFGGSAAYFDGAGDVIARGSGMALGTGDFTIEAWVYIDSLSTNFAVLDQRGAGNVDGVFLYVGTSGAVNLEMRSTTPSYSGGSSTAAAAVSTGAWHLITACRQVNTYYIFVDGVLLHSGVNGSGYNFSNDSALLGWTNDSNTSYAANGFIDELRVSKVCRYTAAFTPDAAEFPADGSAPGADAYFGSVASLLHFDGAGTTFTDQKGKVLTPSGDAQITTADWVFGSASVVFDGSGDYLTTPSSTDFDFGSGNFTIEFWIKTTQTTSYATLLAREWGAGYTGGFTVFLNSGSSGPMQIWCADYSTSAAFLTASGTGYRDGLWHHIAFVRVGTAFNLYIDGVSVGSATSSFVFSPVSKAVTIGNDITFGPRYYNGRMDELRITKGVARYTTTFTPPIAAFSDN